MKIVVCIKTMTGASVDRDDAFERAGRTSPSKLAPFDMHAIEEALRLRERGVAHEVVLVVLGDAAALGAVREGLAMGADKATMLCDDALAGLDLLGVSRVFAELLRQEAADLFLTCSWSGDADGTLLWVMVAERLGLPAMGQVRKLSVGQGQIKGERQAEAGDLILTASLPCLVEVSDTINKPRYLTMKGKQSARTKPVRFLSLVQAGAAFESAQGRGAGTRVLDVVPFKTNREKIIIEGDSSAPDKILSFLMERKLLP